MLRPYQQKAVDALRAEYAQGAKAPLFVLPTGGGKTYVFCHIADKIVSAGKRAVILVHRQELLMQASRSLRAMGVPHGLIAPGFRDNREPIMVASVQTLRQRMKKSTPEQIAVAFNFDLVIIDEAHHAVAGTWKYIIDHLPGNAAILGSTHVDVSDPRNVRHLHRILGVTATPCRSDGKGLGTAAGGVFDAMVQGPTIRALIAMGFLVQPVVYAPPSQVDLTGVRTTRGKTQDYNQRDLAGAVDKPRITGSAVAHYARLCPGKPAIVFCASVEHAQHVAAEFRAAGFRFYAIDGAMADGERRGLIAGLGNGDVDGLCSCDIISEGTDIPVVEAAILLRPTQSEGLYLQQVGRALRPAPGKQRALILDHVGNCLVHGLPDDDRDWSLDGAAKKKRGAKDQALPSLWRCKAFACFAMNNAAATTCQHCGAAREVAARTIEQVDGELKPLTAEEIEAIRRKRKAEQGKAQSLEDLIELGKQRNYKNPIFWARKVLQARGVRA